MTLFLKELMCDIKLRNNKCNRTTLYAAQHSCVCLCLHLYLCCFCNCPIVRNIIRKIVTAQNQFGFAH